MNTTATHSSIWFRNVCRKNGLYLSDVQVEELEKFVSLLLRKNAHVNLISRKDEHNIWENHILHSISPLFCASFSQIDSMLDLGTGGGLPGIPLKIMLPSIKMTLVDSIGKKIQAVQQIVRELSLPDVDTVCSRGEDLTKKTQFRNSFDVVVCRAVGPLKKLVRWSSPLLRKISHQRDSLDFSKKSIEIHPGTLVAFKGGELQKEIEETKKIAALKSLEVVPLVFHGSESLSVGDKKIVIIEF